MFDRIFTVATAVAIILQSSAAIIFFGALAVIMLTSFSVIAVPY